MRTKLILGLVISLSVIGAVTYYSEGRKCTGAKDCHACTNCKYCKYCAKNGGTCGVCK